MSNEPENATLTDLIRDLLLAMVSSQNEANKAFIESIEGLAATDVTISYTKNVGDKKEKKEIKGNALSLGILPTWLNIQSGTIEIRTALSTTHNQSSAGQNSKTIDERPSYIFKINAVDAKYQNAYSYKAETSSLIRVTVVPVPPSQVMSEIMKSTTSKNTLSDTSKK